VNASTGNLRRSSSVDVIVAPSSVIRLARDDWIVTAVWKRRPAPKEP
jgi:hypothetical protein